MTPFDDYLATLTPAQQAEFKRIRGILMKLIPSATQGMSYAMPAFIYNGKAVLCVMVNKKFLSLYPFSGKVIDILRDKLGDFELTTGSIHFSVEHPIPEKLLKEIIRTRVAQIDE